VTTETRVRRLHHVEGPTSDAFDSAYAQRYFRKWTRNHVSIPARLEIRLESGRKHTSGSAIIHDISLKGARLGKIVLKKQSLPAAYFRIHIAFTSEQYQGISAICRPVRFGSGREFELAVEFEHISVREEAQGR